MPSMSPGFAEVMKARSRASTSCPSEETGKGTGRGAERTHLLGKEALGWALPRCSRMGALGREGTRCGEREGMVLSVGGNFLLVIAGTGKRCEG